MSVDEDNTINVIKDNWASLEESYQFVNLDNYPGFTTIQNYELFLAQYSTSKII
jgi:hypothetical protein